MKATIVSVFQDKITKEHYSVGQVIDKDKSRIDELVKAGLVKVEKVTSDDVAEAPKKVKKATK